MGGGVGVRVGGRIECNRDGRVVLKRIAGCGMDVCCAGGAGGRDGSEIELGMEFDGKLNAVCSGCGLDVCVSGRVRSGRCCGVGMASILIVVSLISWIRLGRGSGISPRLLTSLLVLNSDADNGIAGMRRWEGSLKVDGGEM